MVKKTKKSAGSVNVDAVRREAQKLVKTYDPKPQNRGFGFDGSGEASPGSTKRQSALEQDIGTQKYREMIHDHNKKNEHILDKLPFQFPKKKMIRSHLNVTLECPNCQNQLWGTEHTVGVICNKCHKYVTPRNPEAELRGYDPSLVVGIDGTATDRLNLKEEKKTKSP